MLTTVQIEAMRTQQSAALPDTCVILQRTLTRDDYGGHSETWEQVGEAPCRIAVTSGKELEIAAKLTERRTVTITLPHGTSIAADHRVRSDGRTFEILAVLDGGEWSTALRVLAAEDGA